MSGLDAHLVVADRLDAALTSGPGEVVAVVGPNGAGKSTLVHALSGLVAASGRAVLDGVDLLARTPRDRNVGVVFQDQRLFPHLSALDNVAFGLRSRRASRPWSRDGRRSDLLDRRKAADWLTRLGIADLADRRPGRLSGGQAQRVSIARALATDPDLLLLDEPFTGLDVGVAATLRIELGRHLSDFGGITVLVTHDALDALTLATSVAVLDGGRVAQFGTPGEVSARPRTEHVARLVGLNVIRDGDRLRAFSPAAVTVGLQAPSDSTRNRWQGVVRGAAPHGDAIRIQVSGERDLIADVTPAASRELALAPGQQVWLSVKETAVTTYDA